MYQRISESLNERLTMAMAKLARVQVADEGLYAFMDTLIELPKIIAASWFRLSPEQKRGALQAVLSNCVLKAGNLRYEINSPFSIRVEKGESETWWRIGDSNS